MDLYLCYKLAEPKPLSPRRLREYVTYRVFYVLWHVLISDYFVQVSFVYRQAARVDFVEPVDFSLADHVNGQLAAFHPAMPKIFCKADMACRTTIDHLSRFDDSHIYISYYS